MGPSLQRLLLLGSTLTPLPPPPPIPPHLPAPPALQVAPLTVRNASVFATRGLGIALLQEVSGPRGGEDPASKGWIASAALPYQLL